MSADSSADSPLDTLIARDRELVRGKIVSETAKIPWLELQRFFAAGKLMRVGDGLDLVDVAYAMQQDELTLIEQWTGEGLLAPVSDAEARDWHDVDASLWAVVIKPWVLVQEIRLEP